MSVASDHYEERFLYWLERWQSIPRWRWYKRACAFGRWKFFLVMMTEQIHIDLKETHDVA